MNSHCMLCVCVICGRFQQPNLLRVNSIETFKFHHYYYDKKCQNSVNNRIALMNSYCVRVCVCVRRAVERVKGKKEKGMHHEFDTIRTL